MKTNLETMTEAEELTQRFRVSGLSEEALNRIKEERLIWPYVAPFSRNYPTPTHVGYEYFASRGQITKDIMSQDKQRRELQTMLVADLRGKITWGSNIGHCTDSWYAYLHATETGIVYERTLANFTKRVLHKVTLGTYKPPRINFKGQVRVGELFSSDNKEMILPACYEFALQRVTGNKEIKVLPPAVAGDKS